MSKSMNFNATQTHNRFDCEPSHGGGRYGMTRRVDLRIGYIITVFGQTPTGFTSVQAIVDRLNRNHKGAGYTYNDVYPTLLRMRDEAGIVTFRSGTWALSPKAKEVWSKIERNVRGA